MATSFLRIAALGGIAALVLAGCGGGGGGSNPLPGGTGGSGTVSPSNFSGLSAAPMAVGDARPFTPAETGYTGSYTATSSAPGVVAVSPSSGTGPFMATAGGQGSATITVADSLGHTSTVPLSVGSIGFGALSTANMTPGSTQQFTPTESGNASFTVASSAPNVIAVSPASGAGPFTLTAGAPGTATITVTDPNGGHASTTLTVASSGSGATPSPAPTATPAPPAPTATPAPAVALSPSSLSVGLNQVGTVGVADNAGGTSFTAAVANPAIATAVSNGNGSYSIAGNQPGSTTVTFTDNLGHTAMLPVTVPASPAPAIVLSTIGDNNGITGIGANAVVITPSEAGYNGTFTASISSGSNATVAPVLNTFAVATTAAGSSIVTVSDNQGNHSSIGFTAQ
jgi:hypothetical protein